ncbi:hypothetical protein ABIE13_003313 [Ottowia thiooxydans]|uniref:Uncharacterized protein n=1 Tax=Ottowia thiooxydans TaxID=219182 RepID=A0ABV2QB87_9BURK
MYLLLSLLSGAASYALHKKEQDSAAWFLEAIALITLVISVAP